MFSLLPHELKRLQENVLSAGGGDSEHVTKSAGAPKATMLKVASVVVEGAGSGALSQTLATCARSVGEILRPLLIDLAPTVTASAGVDAANTSFERLLSGWYEKTPASDDDFNTVATGLITYWERHDALVAGHPGVVVLDAVLGSDAAQPAPPLFAKVLELLSATTWGADTVTPTVDSSACVAAALLSPPPSNCDANTNYPLRPAFPAKQPTPPRQRPHGVVIALCRGAGV